MIGLGTCTVSSLLLGLGGAAEVSVPFTSDHWNRSEADSSIVQHLGRESLLLRQGRVWLPELALENGVIEVDLAVTGRRAYVGLAFRMQGEGEHESFYVRPHQSGKPDACQYTPVHHGSSAWQLYPDGGAAVELEPERWIRLRLVFWEDVLQVFVGSATPQLVTRLRRDPHAGPIGLQVPGYDPAWFSDFRYRSLEVAPAGLELDTEPPLAGLIPSWSVSDAISEDLLRDRFELDASELDALAWHPLAADPSGVTNLARLHAPRAGADTCFARLRLHAEAETPITLAVGFSDRLRVYHDRRLVFAADDSYRSRDHRFLGTIGLHDRLTFWLQPGSNELLFAVSETFGGWGLLAQLTPAAGVRVE